jgi:hypothetical protein
MIRHRRIFILAYLAAALVLFFQNCSEVKIEMASLPPVQGFATVNFSAEGCVNSIKVAPEKTKFIFVVDLSRSNMGDFEKGNYLFNGAMYPGYSFWNAGLATDPQGLRFQALSNFISTCGSTSNNSYSLIGFSNSAGEIAKDIKGVNTLTCQNRFVDSASVNSQLVMMKDAQLVEAQYHTKFVAPTVPWVTKTHGPETAPFIYKETNYVAAIDCLTSTIEKDMAQQDNDTSNYQIFFLSDGEAVATSTGCEAKPAGPSRVKCYTDLLDPKLDTLMKYSSATSKPVRLHALYYTRSGQQNLSIESYMNYLAGKGQTSAPINLGSFQAVDSQEENPFCNLLAVDKSIVYRTNKIYAVNMTSIKVSDNLKLDSDSDGILDEEEAGFEADEDNSHSMVPGVLDGVCKIVGNKSLCLQERKKVTCDSLKINKFGISDCDIKILKLDKLAYRPELVGIDSDNDGLPDIIEILKGTSPINADAHIDLDNDGLNNIQEISSGLDPFTPDVDNEKLISSSSVFKDTIDQCTSGGWHFDIDALKGANGKNKLMFFFRTESKNTAGVFEYRNYNMTFDVKVHPDTSIDVSINEPPVDPDKFQLVLPEVSK